jgi:pimeloyl-ACP methyl ester carboxylesterase
MVVKLIHYFPFKKLSLFNKLVFMKEKTRKNIIVISIILSLICFAYFVLISPLLREIMFPRYIINVPDSIPNNHESIWFETEQGKVELWFLTGNGISEKNPGATVIYAHGNAEIIDFLPERLAAYQNMGINVVLCEYRGYGRSAGNPSQEHILNDFIYCYDYITQRPDVDNQNIFFHGRSIGTGVICALARVRRPKAIILQAPFISTKELVYDKFPMIQDYMIKDPFKNFKVLADYPGPVLIFHGRFDNVIKLSHSEYLQSIIKNSQLIITESGHRDILFESEYCWERINQFLRENKILH